MDEQKATNEFQGIDLNKLEEYWKAAEPNTEVGQAMRTMHLELIGLVRETNFLGQVETARRDLADDGEVELDPEAVLPSQQ